MNVEFRRARSRFFWNTFPHAELLGDAPQIWRRGTSQVSAFCLLLFCFIKWPIPRKEEHLRIILKVQPVAFNVWHILLYMDNLIVEISDMINIIIPMGKCQIHCCYSRNTKSSFASFMNELRMFFVALKKNVHM